MLLAVEEKEYKEKLFGKSMQWVPAQTLIFDLWLFAGGCFQKLKSLREMFEKWEPVPKHQCQQSGCALVKEQREAWADKCGNCFVINELLLCTEIA